MVAYGWRECSSKTMDGAQHFVRWCTAKHEMVRTKTFDGARCLILSTVASCQKHYVENPTIAPARYIGRNDESGGGLPRRKRCGDRVLRDSDNVGADRRSSRAGRPLRLLHGLGHEAHIRPRRRRRVARRAKCARREAAGLGEGEARTAKQPQGPARGAAKRPQGAERSSLTGCRRSGTRATSSARPTSSAWSGCSSSRRRSRSLTRRWRRRIKTGDRH